MNAIRKYLGLFINPMNPFTALPNLVRLSLVLGMQTLYNIYDVEVTVPAKVPMRRSRMSPAEANLKSCRIDRDGECSSFSLRPAQ
jgi:hypothetical protein